MGKVIRNGTIVTAGDTYQADLLIEGEQIVQIGAAFEEGEHTFIDATDMLVMPGGIDVHTHLELPVSGTVSSDDFFTGTRAAAFGGTTTIIDFAIQPEGGTLLDGIALWHEKARGKACIDYGFHANVSQPGEAILADLPKLLDQGVSSVKLLMAYKGTLMVDDTTLFRVMQMAAELGLLVMVHAENGDVIAALTEDLLSEGKKAPHYHLQAHPEAAESEATCRAVSMAGITGANTYIVHMTCAGAVEQLAIGQANGYPVTGETCVQYLSLFEERLLPAGNDPFAGAKYVCSPPLRTEADAGVLFDALADGTLRVVSTDHCPFYYEGSKEGKPAGKELGKANFALIPNGLPAIEDRLVVTWHLGVNGLRLSPNRFVRITSTEPARLFGMYPRKGTIAVGSDADLVVWNPNKVRQLTAGAHHMNVDYNAFEGLEVTGWPEKVFLRGKMIVDGDQWLGEKGAGRFVRRGPADMST